MSFSEFVQFDPEIYYFVVDQNFWSTAGMSAWKTNNFQKGESTWISFNEIRVRIINLVLIVNFIFCLQTII